MNILTFDIEDWYNCDFLSQEFNWDKFEVRIYDNVDMILKELSSHNLIATFFCLGWLAEKHPEIIRRIHKNGHQIGCHSYQHQLAYRFDKDGFRADTIKAKQLIEDVIGEPITCFRAPGFSITQNNLWAMEIISELGFIYDCSVFPAQHEYGGLPNFGEAEPVLIKLPNGNFIKEFPMSIKNICGKRVVYSGGGFFRIFPYKLIKYWASRSNYVMTYFHPRDFDKNQPILMSLPIHRKIKSYIGLSKSFPKFQKLLTDFDFVSLAKADIEINWHEVRIINLEDL